MTNFSELEGGGIIWWLRNRGLTALITYTHRLTSLCLYFSIWKRRAIAIPISQEFVKGKWVFIHMNHISYAWNSIFSNKCYLLLSTQFFIALLRDKSHIIQVTHLKYTIQWLLIYSWSCATINFRIFSSFEKEPLQLLAKIPASPQP